MKLTESILRPVKMVSGGIRLHHNKNTADMESVSFEPKTVYIPTSQHIGAPCVPIVEKGQQVYIGTRIADSQSYVSAPIHSSVSGKVIDIVEKTFGGVTKQYIVIESDELYLSAPDLKPQKNDTAEDIAIAAKNCGLVGLGGAGFPTHGKLSPKDDVRIDTLVVNCAECEPYITSDYRECIENYDDVLDCIYLLKEKLQLDKVIIGVESNKPKAIKRLYQICTDKKDVDDTVKLMKLPAQYPQGAEKVIIYSATGRVLPAGKLPSDIGCMVLNITSLGTLYRYIMTGMPLTHKRITLDGTAVKEPKNYIVPVGTKISDLLEFAGCIDEDAEKIIVGGPMMGSSVADKEASIEKRNNAVLVMKAEPMPETTPCIRCGRCAGVCTMRLYPSMVETAYNMGDTERLAKLNVNYCMECGSCSYICPAKRPLTQIMKAAKAELRRKKQ